MGDSNSSSGYCWHFDNQGGRCSLLEHPDCNGKSEQSFKTCDIYKEHCLRMAEKLEEKNRQMVRDEEVRQRQSSNAKGDNGDNIAIIGGCLILCSILLGILFDSFAIGIIGFIAGVVCIIIGIKRDSP